MNRMMSLALPLIALAAITATACSQQPTDGPPVVRYGQDECIHCGMILTDERHVAALRLSDADEIRDVLFDDIGDMLEYEREQAGLIIVRRYVHDFQTRQWTDAAAAHFLVSDKIHTPMGSGIVAFAELPRGQAMQKEDGGRLLNLADLTASLAAQAVAGTETDACCADDDG